MSHESKKRKAGYMISAISKIYDIHPQTLRQYEREGLLKPSRSEGNTRLYTEEDIERLEIILNLTRELGVNLAGVEIILNMRDRMEQLNNGIEVFIEYLREKLGEEFHKIDNFNKEGLIKVSPAQIIKMEIDRMKSRS